MTGRWGEREFANPCHGSTVKNAFFRMTLCVYPENETLGTVFSQVHETVLNLMSYEKVYNVLLDRLTFLITFTFLCVAYHVQSTVLLVFVSKSNVNHKMYA